MILKPPEHEVFKPASKKLECGCCLRNRADVSLWFVESGGRKDVLLRACGRCATSRESRELGKCWGRPVNYGGLGEVTPGKVKAGEWPPEDPHKDK